MGKKIGDDVLDELLKGCERPKDLLGDGGLMKELKKALMQRMLGAELSSRCCCCFDGRSESMPFAARSAIVSR